jgi:large repetitive protein
MGVGVDVSLGSRLGVDVMGAHSAFEAHTVVETSKRMGKKSLGLRIAHTLLALEHRVLFDGAGAGLGAIALGAKSVHVNLAPDIAHPDQVSFVEDATVRFDLPSSAPIAEGHAQALVVSDADQGSGNYVLELSTAAGQLRVESNVALTLSGNGSSTLRVEGALSDINQTLSSLTLTGAPRVYGSSQLVAQVTDPANASARVVVGLDIAHLNHAPVANDDNRAFYPSSGPISGNVLTGLAPGDVADSDPDGDALVVAGVAEGAWKTPLGNAGQTIEGRYGTLVLNADGSYVYTPGAIGFSIPANSNLYEYFSYTVCDIGGKIDSANLAITLCGPGIGSGNRAPIAVDDARCVTEGGSLSDGQAIRGNALGDSADRDPDGDVLSVQAVGVGRLSGNNAGLLASHVDAAIIGNFGSLILHRDGSYSYATDSRSSVLHAGDTVSDSFTYAVSDATGSGAIATITICVLGVDGGLLANPDQRSITEPTQTSGPQRVEVCGNVVSGGQVGDQTDIDQDGDPIRVQGVSTGLSAGVLNSIVNGQLQGTVLGSFGTLVLAEDGAYCYVPDARAQCLGPDQNVSDVFSYTINDGRGNTSTTTLTILIQGENHRPVANPDQNSVMANALVPTLGNVVLGAGRPGASAGDRADTDPDACDVIQVCATAVNEALAGTIVVDRVGQTVTGSYGSLMLQADGSYSYTVDSNNATVRGLSTSSVVLDTFTYTVCDNFGAKSSTTLEIRIVGVNDPNGSNRPPVAVSDQRCIVEGAGIYDGQALVGNALGDQADSDPDGDAIKVQAAGVGLLNGTVGVLSPTNVAQPMLGSYGTLTLQQDGRYIYVSDARSLGLRDGQVAQDVFTYAISDPSGRTSVATITVCVLGMDAALIANPDVRNINEPVQTTGPNRVEVCGDVVKGGQIAEQADVDQEGDPIRVQGLVAGANNGVLNSVVNGQLQGTVRGSYGTLEMAADGTYCYVPDGRAQCLGPNDLVSDVFSYTINDGHSNTSTTTLTINIQGQNQAPVANPDQNSVLANAVSPSTGNVLLGAGKPGASAGDRADLDPDACDVIQVCATGAAQAIPGTVMIDRVGQTIVGTFGTLVLQADGSYVYTVNVADASVRALAPNASLLDTFTYTICDDHGAKASTTLDIRIVGVNDPPTAPVEVRTIAAGAKPGSAECLIQGIPAPTDPDLPAQSLVITVTSLPDVGNGLFLLPSGQPVKVGDILSTAELQNLCFIPADAPITAKGPDGLIAAGSLGVTVNDGHGGTANGSITVNIRPQDGPPVPSPSPSPAPVVGGVPAPAPAVSAPAPAVSAPAPAVPPVLITPPGSAGSNTSSTTSGFVEPVLGLAPIFRPLSLSEVRLTPVTSSLVPANDARALLPFEAPVREVVAGVTETERVVKKEDDCIPAAKPVKVAARTDAVKVKPKARVLASRPLADFAPIKALNFSESLKHAQKRFKPPAKVAPAGIVEKIC